MIINKYSKNQVLVVPNCSGSISLLFLNETSVISNLVYLFIQLHNNHYKKYYE